jgi:hypothetical protein
LGRDTSCWVVMMSCWVVGTRIFTFGFTTFGIRHVLLLREYEQVNLIGSILIINSIFYWNYSHKLRGVRILVMWIWMYWYLYYSTVNKLKHCWKLLLLCLSHWFPFIELDRYQITYIYIGSLPDLINWSLPDLINRSLPDLYMWNSILEFLNSVSIRTRIVA